jgi:hypothetical protein
LEDFLLLQQETFLVDLEKPQPNPNPTQIRTHTANFIVKKNFQTKSLNCLKAKKLNETGKKFDQERD